MFFYIAHLPQNEGSHLHYIFNTKFSPSHAEFKIFVTCLNDLHINIDIND